MEAIKLNRSISESKRQVLFILHFLRSLELNSIKKRLIQVLILTAVLAGSSIFTGFDHLIGFYIVTALVWTLFLLFVFIKYLKYRFKRQRLIKIIELEFKEIKDCFLDFNEDMIKVNADKETSELKWEYFKAYFEGDNTIYLLMNNLYDHWSFSIVEIGSENLQELRELVRKKLLPLK